MATRPPATPRTLAKLGFEQCGAGEAVSKELGGNVDEVNVEVDDGMDEHRVVRINFTGYE